jgi:hypothetical protein
MHRQRGKSLSWFGIIVLSALCGGIGCAINQSKNRSGGEGFLLGALLGIIGVIIVLCLPKLPAAELPRAWPSLPPPGWYQDPTNPTQHRYWDGQRWSDPPPIPPIPQGYRPSRLLAPGTPVKVVATGDQHEGQVGVVHELVDADEDGLDVCVKFHGDTEAYAFSHNELIAVER